MIRNDIIHCLNALGIVAKKQRFYEFVVKKLKIIFHIYKGVIINKPVKDASNKTTSNAPDEPYQVPLPPERLISLKNRIFIIVASLLALFLAALDALVMGAAMPSIVARLGGLHLYSWAFSSYLLSRTVTLPLFGKLCDLYSNKKLFNVSICIFLAGSVLAGISRNMTQLILSRRFRHCCQQMSNKPCGKS